MARSLNLLPTEESLRRSEEHFDSLVSAVRDYAIFMLDPEGRVASWNAGAEHIKGYRREEIIGHHFSRFYPQEAIDRGWPQHELAVAQVEGRFEDEGWRLRKDGTQFWANVVITPLFDEGGRLRGFTKVTRDLTERKRAEDELRLAHADLERRVEERTRELIAANAALKVEVDERQRVERELRETVLKLRRLDRNKDEFLAMLGHELRNPLAPIRTALELMKLQADPTTERERAIIDRQVLHLTQLVDDLLDISRITQGKTELHPEPLELAIVVDDAVEIASPLLEERQHSLDADVPRAGLMVRGDRRRLAQVAANLLTNAAKYTDPGGRIVVSARREGEQAALAVRDSGHGIDPALLPHVFELFVQERQSLDRKAGGLGLGLAIVRSLVSLHGGSVSATSELGQGSEFTIRLPLLAAGDLPEPEAADPPAVPAVALRRVLVVDDNQDAAVLLGDLLRLVGYEVEVALDGPSALGVAPRFQPDVALLDIGLPVMDGYELARWLRALPGLEGLKLIAVTGYGQPTDRARSREAGFDEHLVKPLDLDAACAAIEELTADHSG